MWSDYFEEAWPDKQKAKDNFENTLKKQDLNKAMRRQDLSNKRQWQRQESQDLIENTFKEG